MRNKLFLTSVLLLGVFSSAAVAGSQISIRLVEASNSGRGSPVGLNDVSGILKNNMGLDSCAFVASVWVQLPGDRQSRRLGDYEVTCSGRQSSLTIVVQKQGKRLLKTNVDLQDNKPLILGGFPSAGGKHVLVFLVQ